MTCLQHAVVITTAVSAGVSLTVSTLTNMAIWAIYRRRAARLETRQ